MNAARIRTVKPSIFVHGLLFDIGELLGYGALVRLAYIGLWCYTDREARFEWQPRELKTGILPNDDCDFALILNAFANAGLVVRYVHEGRAYGWIPRFLDHQNINGRESATRLPAPPADAVAVYEQHLLRSQFHTYTRADLIAEPATAGAQGLWTPKLRDNSGTPAPAVSDSSDNHLHERSRVADASESGGHATRGEGKGREGNRREGKGRRTATALSGAEERARPESAADAGSSDAAVSGGDAVPVAPAGTLDGVAAHSGGTSLVVVEDGARNVPALPPVRGKPTAAALRERMATVLGEVHDGTRTRMKREQVRRLNAELVFLYWQARFDHPNAILTPNDKRRARIEARLRENDDNVSELLYALDGAYHDDHIMARGRYEGDTKYDGIDTILRDRAQVEKFAGRRKGFVEGKPHKALAQMITELRGEDVHMEGDGNGQR